MNNFDCHKEIINEICLYLNNCANCYNEETRCTECNPAICTSCQIYEKTETTFCMDIYSKETNDGLIRIASQYGYDAEIVGESGQECLEFRKK